MLSKFVPIIVLLWSQVSWAVPEAARYGQSSCSSCHISPGGGGVLTNYGRMFASEKLSTWSHEGEENLLHGLLGSSDVILGGGDARWVSYRTNSGKNTTHKFWRMQTDFELAIHWGNLWVQSMMGTKPAGPLDNQKDHGRLVHRGYSIRYDLFDEHLLVRAGLFLPKFGLMNSDHTAFNRMALGFDPEAEQTQVEATYQDDDVELTISSLFKDDTYDRAQKTKSGLLLGFSRMFAQKQRLTLSALKATKKSSYVRVTDTGVALASVISLAKELFAMIELDRIKSEVKESSRVLTRDSFASYATVNYEILRGLSTFVRYEFWNRDMNIKGNKLTRYGAGLNWYPRPHFQFEARSLISSRELDSRVASESTFVLHYYF